MATEGLKALAIKVLQRNRDGVEGENKRKISGNFRAKKGYKSFLDIYEGIKRLKESELEEYEERAAIMEFDGNMPRKEAERKALERILEKRKRHLLN